MMNGFARVMSLIYSVVISLISIVLLYALVDDGIFADLLSPLSSVVTSPVGKYIYAAVLMIFLITAVYVITTIITTGRLSKTRVRSSEIGTVDIGTDAIESIALNSAKSAQVGIKNARVKVMNGKNGGIKVVLLATLYSNVEIPSSMTKVQEKVKKDIERYTGIGVDSVFVKVSRVEPLAAKVEK